MTYIFDGKAFAFKKKETLRKKYRNIYKNRGKKPKLVTFLVGQDPASVLYVNLKKRFGDEVGAVVLIRRFEEMISKNDLISEIEEANKDKSINGIMLQLPLPKSFSKDDRDQIINTISDQKDVDGMKIQSQFTHPTVRAILDVLAISNDYMLGKNLPNKVALVGATGFIGSHLLDKTKKLDSDLYNFYPLDSKSKNFKKIILEANIVISATGIPNIIKSNMVKGGVVLIDVGSPKGDIEKNAYSKACFVSPVPGGIGPVTISYLFENLLEKDI